MMMMMMMTGPRQLTELSITTEKKKIDMLDKNIKQHI
jgi:hypothetical protein